MLQPLSQIEISFRDTLIQKAEGPALDLLSGLYGIPRIRAIDRRFWRGVLKAAALGPRDRLCTLFAVLEAMLEPWSAQTDTTCDLEAASPQKLIGGTPAGSAWGCPHTHRLIKVGDKGVFWSTGVDGSDLTLAAVPTSYWQGAAWAEDEADVPVRVLPFWIKEYGAEVEIYLDADLFTVPASYLQPNSTDPLPAGQPEGAALLEDASVRTDLPGPLYLPARALAGLIEAVLDSLCAAGVDVGLYSLNWCSTQSLGVGSFSDPYFYGRVVGGTIPTPAPLTGWSP